MSVSKLPKNFRKLPIEERQDVLAQMFSLEDSLLAHITQRADILQIVDTLIESAIGTFPVPLGLATGFLIDGIETVISMATEEPSVILAASHAAQLIKRGGGFTTWADKPITSGQIFFRNAGVDATQKIEGAKGQIELSVNDKIPNMVKRGGGFRGVSSDWSADHQILCVTIDIEVCDAMGANVVNTVVEGLSRELGELIGGNVVMSILTNSATKRLAGAKFTVPARLFAPGVCERIIEATKIANMFPDRAVTHNKGIMNGVTALVLATGNDTRAVEAAVHTFAKGKSLTKYSYDTESQLFSGELMLPLALGTVGGSISVWPASQLSMKLLGQPNAQRLARIAVALGLAQNLAALTALVTTGIQAGHMTLHNKRKVL